MASIYLIRHGQASFGAENYDQLSPLGCRQAEVLGEYLRDCGIHLDAAYSGDLQRQRKTAELALAAQPSAVEYGVDPRFNEIKNDEQIEHLMPAIIEQQPEIREIIESGLDVSKNFQKIVEASFNYWVSPKGAHPAIQSWPDFSLAVREALQQVMTEQGAGKSIGIFTSGGTIATLVAQSLGLQGEHTYRFYEPVINCSVTQLFYSGGGSRVSLSYFNDHSFLSVLGSQQQEQLVTYR